MGKKAYVIYGLPLHIDAIKHSQNLTDISPVSTAAGKGAFLAKMAMNPANRRIIAAAVTIGAQGTTPNRVAVSRNRGNCFRKNILPTSDAITAMVFTRDGKHIYVNTVDATTRKNTVYKCRVRNWDCTTIGEPPTTQFVHQLVAHAKDNDKLFLIAHQDRVDYRNPQVHYFDGSVWYDMTIVQSNLDNSPLGGAMAYIHSRGANTIVVATSKGIMIPNGDVGVSSHTNWKIIATGIPVVSIMDMLYDETDDILVVATMGRGVWYLKHASRWVTGRSHFGWLFGLFSLRSGGSSQKEGPGVEEEEKF